MAKLSENQHQKIGRLECVKGGKLSKSKRKQAKPSSGGNQRPRTVACDELISPENRAMVMRGQSDIICVQQLLKYLFGRPAIGPTCMFQHKHIGLFEETELVQIRMPHKTFCSAIIQKKKS